MIRSSATPQSRKYVARSFASFHSWSFERRKNTPSPSCGGTSVAPLTKERFALFGARLRRAALDLPRCRLGVASRRPAAVRAAGVGARGLARVAFARRLGGTGDLVWFRQERPVVPVAVQGHLRDARGTLGARVVVLTRRARAAPVARARTPDRAGALCRCRPTRTIAVETRPLAFRACVEAAALV